MEIQFSIPIASGRSNSSAASSSLTESERSAKATASRGGGTHRFALETRARHTRRSSMCVLHHEFVTNLFPGKKRHVKCDETKPSCLNCLKWKGSCDGYGDASATPSETAPNESKPRPAASKKSTTSSATKSRATSKIKVSTGSTAVVKARPPTLPEEPPINTICFTSTGTTSAVAISSPSRTTPHDFGDQIGHKDLDVKLNYVCERGELDVTARGRVESHSTQST
ncbi:Zn2-C6 fungal-type DNA-binding domain [Fusarium oxysporum f. sp. vasinfectum]|nr:Zn2-C6 fungal-type DNA-binding domain [Fusarium oxysporum f. sp. vasinfectum]